jgi:hypothetical protein
MKTIESTEEVSPRPSKNVLSRTEYARIHRKTAMNHYYELAKGSDGEESLSKSSHLLKK